MSMAARGSLSASVLVLNRFYMVVHVINVRRAICLLFRELAEVIHLEEGQYANYNFESWLEISQLRASVQNAAARENGCWWRKRNRARTGDIA